MELAALTFLDASTFPGPLNVVRGTVFERAMIALIKAGSTFRVRELRTGIVTDGHLWWRRGLAVGHPSMSSSHWRQGMGATVLVPASRNRAGLDALVWDARVEHHVPIECTVAGTHGIHAGGLFSVVKALGWTLEGGWPAPAGAAPSPSPSPSPSSSPAFPDKVIPYYFVVPEDKFDAGTSVQPWKPGSMPAGDWAEAAAAAVNAVRHLRAASGGGAGSRRCGQGPCAVTDGVPHAAGRRVRELIAIFCRARGPRCHG
jgi:hypothetical protein